MKRVVVHIDRLVLKGFWYEDQHIISEGLRERLTRVFSGSEAKPSDSGAQAAHEIALEINP
jgi:hypothetical protein